MNVKVVQFSTNVPRLRVVSFQYTWKLLVNKCEHVALDFVTLVELLIRNLTLLLLLTRLDRI